MALMDCYYQTKKQRNSTQKNQKNITCLLLRGLSQDWLIPMENTRYQLMGALGTHRLAGS